MGPIGFHDEIQRMLSAYLDDELTQADSQRVRLHVEDCPECAATLQQMRELRELTAAVAFAEPPQERMDRIERTLSVRAPRRTGWLLILGGLTAWLAYAAVLAWGNWPPRTDEIIAGTIAIGVVLLFISVLRTRLIELPHDRYRRVKR
ncbi:MAG: zf-HC2 domain-containing protein [Bryobacteraceae bacterium]